jgi:hypothetical protein
LGNLYYAPLETETKKIVAGYRNLTAYLDRIRSSVTVPTA